MEIFFDPEILPLMVSLVFAFSVILLIMCITALVMIRKLSNRMDRFMGTRSERHNIEEILIDYYDHVDMVDSKYKRILEEVDKIYERLEPCIQKVGIVRYNPFQNMGGDLSYSLTLLDEHDDGIIINTIFSRESSHTYCKPIMNGKSDYPLSYEEEISLKRALGTEKKRGTDAFKIDNYQEHDSREYVER